MNNLPAKSDGGFFGGMLPEIKTNGNFIDRYFERKKAKHLAEITDDMVHAANNMLSLTKINTEYIIEQVTLSAKVADSLHHYEHLKEMRELERDEKRAKINRIYMENEELSSRSELLKAEAKYRLFEIEMQMRKAERE